MFRELENRRPAACLSDLSLDSYLASEASASSAATTRAHLESCAHCSQRLRAFVAERAQFLASARAQGSGFVAPRKSRAAYSTWAAGALAAACLLFVLTTTKSAQNVREKGSAELGFYLKRGEQVQRGRSAQRVRPGDLVRFVYSSSRPRYLAVLSLDAAQHASVYFPDGPVAARVTEGTDVALPSSVLLDQTLGREQVVALFCDTPVLLAPLQSTFAQSGSLPRVPDGCEMHTLALQKEALEP
jgi:anti-sigma factor RsiW